MDRKARQIKEDQATSHVSAVTADFRDRRHKLKDKHEKEQRQMKETMERILLSFISRTAGRANAVAQSPQGQAQSRLAGDGG
jgi:malate synthase